MGCKPLVDRGIKWRWMTIAGMNNKAAILSVYLPQQLWKCIFSIFNLTFSSLNVGKAFKKSISLVSIPNYDVYITVNCCETVFTLIKKEYCLSKYAELRQISQEEGVSYYRQVWEWLHWGLGSDHNGDQRPEAVLKLAWNFDWSVIGNYPSTNSKSVLLITM